MSSQVRDWSIGGAEQDAPGRHEGPAATGHPRGMGFSVLSRIARTRAEEADDYAPRHRLDEAVDAAAEPAAI
jgi:hypothetical protein